MVDITLPDGSVKKFEMGVTSAEIAKSISEGLFRKAFGALVNGEMKDLYSPITQNSSVAIVTEKDPQAVSIFRHTMAHIMAQAVMHVFGKENVKFAIGPVIDNGFYYDFDIPSHKITEEDFPKIEEEMKNIIKQDIKISRKDLSKKEAAELFADQPYKLELITDIVDDTVSVYTQGDFSDLCRGPHLPSTGMVKYAKILSVSGAYWRGDEKNKMLQRIYATSFVKKDELDSYVTMIEEAKKRDHRKLGPALGLFMIDTDIAPGMAFFLPRDTIALNEMRKLSREIHKKYEYVEVETPQIMNVKLWHQSGHWDHYKENMYFSEKEDAMFAVKPMNCPGHMLIYKNNVVSYRDLPIRIFEFGRVHRYERSGTLQGLFRVRVFTQDDAHIFCRKDQIEDEIIKVMNLIQDMYSPFGFKYEAFLSTMPQDHMGDVETWDIATAALKKALEESGNRYTVNEGDGAFYGPKIDFYLTDSLGRKHQCGTIQLDFQMPERFELTYVGPESEQIRPVMIHRAIFGSLERFFGILIENFAGAFPTWMMPEQVSIIPVSEKFNDQADEFAKKFDLQGIRVSVNKSNTTVNYRVREEQLRKVPYMIVFGEKEASGQPLNIRTRNGNTAENVALDDFIKTLKEEISERKLTLSY